MVLLSRAGVLGSLLSASVVVVGFATPGEAAVKVDASSPKKACETMVEASKQGDFDAIQAVSMGPLGNSPKRAEKGFDKMRQQNMEKLKDLKCGEEQIAMDHATVLAKTDNEERIIPFIKQGESWKFDARTYMTFYSESMKESGVKMKGK